MEQILRLQNVTVKYGGVTALDGVDFMLPKGELVALMGPNGSGKTTLLKALYGLAPLEHGHVYLHGEKISPAPDRLVKMGVVMVPQGKRVFPSLSVRENLQIGKLVRGEEGGQLEKVLELFPDLSRKLRQPAGQLSGGQQQMVALGRGLMSGPHTLLVDEPTLGLAPKLAKEVFAVMRKINQSLGVTMVVVEHNIRSLLDIADHVVVLDKGKVIADQKSGSLSLNKVVQKVFLGALE